MRTLSFLRDGHIMIFHVDVFPLFSRRFFLVMIIYCPLPPLLSVSAPQNTPFLGFFFFRSISFSCTHIYRRLGFPSTDVLSFFGDAFSLLITRTGSRHSFLPRRFPERLQSAAGVAPSLGYLLLFLTVCPHKQNGGLLFLLLWYGGRVGGTATLGVKGRREGGREGGREEEGRLSS